MTDTGQVPGEGLPESVGMVEQPGVPAPGAYTYLSETAAEDEDLLLPGAQGAWGNEMPPPAPEPVVQVVHEPVVHESVVHEPGPHEMSGRDSGSLDLGAVRTPVATPVPQPPVARRPLHLGPLTPDASASPVRSLADRGPAGAPVSPGAVRQPGPPTIGPEYLDVPQQPVPQQPVSQWVGAPATAAPGVAVGGAAAETVVPQEAWLSTALAETSAAVQTPQVAAVAEEIQDAEALHQAQDAAYALAQEAAAAQFRTPEAVGTPVAAQFQAPDAPEATAAPAAVRTEVPEAVEAPAHAPVAVEEPAAVEVQLLEPVEAPAVVQAQVPEPIDAPVVGRAPAPEEAVEPSVPEGAEIAAVMEAPQAEAPQGTEAAAHEAQAFEEAAPADPAAQAPDTTPFPSVAQGPEPVPAQPVAEAQDVPQVPQEPEEVPESVDALVPARLTEADALPQADAVVAEDAEQAVTPEQQAPTAAACEQAEPGLPDAQVATAAPDEESALASPDESAADPVPDTTLEAVLTQDPQQPAEAPAAGEPQLTEAGAAEAETSQAPAEAAQPEAVTEEPQSLEPAQPEPPTVQGPQSIEPVARVADQDQDQDKNEDRSLDQSQDRTEAAVARPAETAPEPEAAQPPVPEAVAEPEPEPTNVNAADESAGSAEAQEAAAIDPSTGEAPADPSEPATDLATEDLATEDLATEDPATEDPAMVDPATAEPLAVEAPMLVAPRIDALQGAVGRPPTEPAPDAPLAEPLQEQALQVDADLTLGQFVPVDGSVPTAPHPHPAPTPPHERVLPSLPADDGPTPVVTEFPAAEGQTEPAESAPAPEAPSTVPSPRDSEAEPIVVPQPLAAADAHPDVVQNVEDLDTRAADQEDSEAAALEAEAGEAAAAEESTAPLEEAPEEVREEVRQPAGPAAPPYDDAEREAVLKVMRERRDIRNGFRDDPIPHDVLLRVLEAAHTAPSVGHSQPWDFVVIRSAETRRTMHELAQRQREAYTKSLPKGRAKQFKELKIEAILDTPVNIVVTADPTRGGRHTLGRHTQPQMAPYSSALAVENLWLAARAEGLGVGWVSFFDEREMVRALGLPEHLEVVAYLCVGYVDEFPEEPELMQAGWAKRRPLSWVVHEETYGRRALPGAEPHDLLAETVAGIRPLDAKALGEAWERQKRMTKPAGALGMLEIISAQLSGLSRQCPPPIPEPAAVAIFAGDHGVHAQGVTPWPQEVTAQMVANFLGGGAVCNAFATQVGAEVCVVDVGVASDLPATPGLLPRKIRAGTSDMTTGPAMTREEAKQAIEVGIETARDLVAAGNKALLTGEMGIANTTASAALIAVFTGADPSEVTGRGTGINDETLARKTEVVRRAIELHQLDPADPIGVLAAIGGFEHAAIVGLLLGGASLRTPVILDGVSAGAAALVARAIAPEVLAACIAGHRSAEPGHAAALQKLGLRPLVDLDLRLGEGTGALLALPVVQSAARAMHEVATFDSAGVTEK